jgi:hypothetical protein
MNKLIPAIAAGILLIALPGGATQTTVDDLYGNDGSIYPNEWNLYNSGAGPQPGNGIMEYLYGIGNFTRLDDSTIIEWVGTSGTASAGIKYSGDSEALYTATLSGAYNSSSPIITVNVESGTPSLSGAVTSFTPVSQPFLFLDIGVPGTVETWAYSDPSLTTSTGAGATDVTLMVAFAVTGYLATPGDQSTWTPFADGTTHYVLAFSNGPQASDLYDFNDLVVEVAGVEPLGVGVPDGGTTVGLLGLALLGIVALRHFMVRKA